MEWLKQLGSRTALHYTLVVYMADIATSGVPSASRRRPTSFIQRKPAGNLRLAVRMAETIGRPLNQAVTLNFSLTDCDSQDASAAFEKLRDNYFGPWLRRASGKGEQDGPPAFVWVIENVSNHTHAHWLVHVPPRRLADFSERVSRWLAAVAGIVQPGAVKIKRAYNPRGFALYMLKGISPAAAFLYRVRPEPQGIVFNKRSGFARCLGPAARKRAGFKAKKWQRLDAAISATGALPSGPFSSQ